MGIISEQLSEQFRRWEERGRGWHIYDAPIFPEPPFRPFPGHYLPPALPVDDGRRPTILSSLVGRLSQRLSGQPPEPPPVIPQREEEPEPEILLRGQIVELQASLPPNFDLKREAFEPFLSSLSLCSEPVTFDILGKPERVTIQFTAHPNDAPLLRQQLQAHFPEASFHSREGALQRAWQECEGDEVLIVEFGLAREFMLPLASIKSDPFVGIVGALAELRQNELGLFQVIFQPVRHSWAESIARSVTHADGKPFFVNAPELAAGAKVKIARPLYAAVVRIALRTERPERTIRLARDLAGSLRLFAHPQGNELIPLENADYPFEEHVEDVLLRQSRRSGMILNADELIGFVHLPGSAVRSAALLRETGKTKAAPAIVCGNGVLLGNNVHNEETIPVRLTPEQRVQHMHLIGVQGTGKSTLLFNLIRQDIESGAGVSVLDPHGDLIDQILGVIPPSRIDDVVLIDPSDEHFSVGFNILSAHTDQERVLLASDLVSIFRRLSTSWGDQMGSVLQNAILAFLESDQGGTLADLRRFLLEPPFREQFLKTVRDADIVYYWRKGFAQLAGNKSIGSSITRLNDFLAPKPIRLMVSQSANRLDFAEILDKGKIFLAKLSEGLVGDENAFLLGSLFVAKFQQLAMGRQAQQAARRKDHFLYIDEFHNFITPSMAKILSGARKYRLGLILAHQELKQLERDRDVASAVLSNPYTRVVFRVGDSDARALESGFSFFEARDFQNLEKGQAICRVEKSDFDFNLSVPFPQLPNADEAQQTMARVVAASRAKYGRLRAEIEAELLAKLRTEDTAPEAAKAKPGSPSSRKVSERKDAEVQNVMVSEKEGSKPSPSIELKPLVIPKPVEAPAPTIIREPAPPRDLGRGGALHKTIQERLQAEAHALGFLAQVEGQVNDLPGKAADLVLKRGALAIAVEITVTTTTDHEFGNVKKCLEAGFSRVAVVSPEPHRLEHIRAAVKAGLGSEAESKVSYHTPDDFLVELRKLAAEESAKPAPPPVPGVRMTRGYKVRRQGVALTPEERRAKEEAAIRLMAETMKARP